MRSIHVDDVSYGADDDNAAFDLYNKSKLLLVEGGFNLRNFVTNSTDLKQCIESTEQTIAATYTGGSHTIIEEDKTYTKDLLAGRQLYQNGE